MAIPELIDALSGFEKQGATMWAADRSAQTAAATRAAEQQQWVAEQQANVYKTMFESSDKLLSDLSNKVFTGEFDIGDTEGANYEIYKTQWNRRSEAFKQWANALGLPTYDSETDIIALVDAMFEETIRTVDDPRKFLKFGDTKGKWAEVVTRLSPGVNLDLVEIVWNDRYNKLKKGGPDITSGLVPGGGATGEFGYTTDIYGGEYTPQKIETGGPWWLDKAANWWKDINVRSDIRDVQAAKKVGQALFESTETRAQRLGERTPSADLSQFEEAAQRRDSASSMLLGIANQLSPEREADVSAYDRAGQASLIARRGVESLEPMMGPGEGLINGFLAQGAEEDEMPELTRQAMNFMVRLSAMMQEYGPEEAFRLMSRDFKALSKSDKAQIEEYLLRRTGRTDGILV